MAYERQCSPAACTRTQQERLARSALERPRRRTPCARSPARRAGGWRGCVHVAPCMRTAAKHVLPGSARASLGTWKPP
jgi:hypothetical protein